MATYSSYLIGIKRISGWQLIIVFSSIVLSVMLLGCSGSKPDIEKRRPLPKQQLKVTNGYSSSGMVKKHSKAENPLNQVFFGTWIVMGSTVEFTITEQNGNVVFSGMDMDDKERIQITAIDWDQSSFSGSFITPSTKHTMTIKLSILNENSLQCDYFGDSTGEAIWLRK